MQEKLRYVFYYSPSCEICAETELLLPTHIRYARHMVTPSANPDRILIHQGEEVVEAPQSMIPALPALWDSQMNMLFIGNESISIWSVENGEPVS